MEPSLSFTLEMGIAVGIVCLAILLFLVERFRIDTSAVFIMLLIGLTGFIPGIEPLIEPAKLFSGFSSNAVLSIIAIMMIGAGLDKTGIMKTLAQILLDAGQPTERWIVARITLCIGLVSAFMQNVGATALFLTVISRISHHAGLPLSRLLMPAGFCAILGGTLTMVGCSSLIVLNDIIKASAHPAIQGKITTLALFDITPIGIVLLGSGVVYFVVFGKYILPNNGIHPREIRNTAAFLSETYGLKTVMYEAHVDPGSPIAGKTIRQIEDSDNAPQILSFTSGKQVQVAPNRDDIIWPGSDLLMLGTPDEIHRFAHSQGLQVAALSPDDIRLRSDLSGLSEVVVPPGSSWIGSNVGDIRLRKHYNANLIGIYRGEETLRKDLRAVRLRSGDTLLLYSRWTDLASLSKNGDFVIASDYPKHTIRPEKQPLALALFALSMGLVLFTDVQLAFALLTGAVGMVIGGVITMDEAYHSVSWKTVFLLASLIPLGMAVNQTGAADWLAHQVLYYADGLPVWAIQAVLAVLATGFTLIISNVGATVLLVPIAMSIAASTGANPTAFALTVALATSNSFLIPTHQVNALIMGPAGYRVADFNRVGGIMTLIYLTILIPAINWLM
jgi:di/tricarboxylate transporter